MADDTPVTQPQTPHEPPAVPPSSVTDAGLSAAWDGAQQPGQPQEPTPLEPPAEPAPGEPAAPQEPPPEPPAEPPDDQPDDHETRSRLGRRLKTVEEKIDAFLARLEQPPPQQPQQPAALPDNVAYDDAYMQRQIDAAVEAGQLPATIMTPHDQLRVNQFVGSLQAQIENQYAVKYLNTLKAPTLKGDTPDDIHAEVVAELQNVESPHNRRRYNNPALDAQINYMEAKNAVLMKRLASGGKTPNVFKGKKPDTPPTGTHVSARTAVQTGDLPALTEGEQDFIRRTGMSAESVTNALKSDLPLHLKGRL